MRASLLYAISALLLVAGSAQAHVTVWPRQSEQGAREKYVIRMPNERSSATVKLEALFPVEARVTSFQQSAGWTLTIRRDSAGAIVGATWTGELPPDQFAEFGIAVVNPKSGERLTWRFVQTYVDGTVVEWAGAPGSKTPAPQVELRPSAVDAPHH